MARKRFSDEDILNLLRQIELALSSGSDVQTACRTVGISDATCLYQRSLSLIRFYGFPRDARCDSWKVG